MTQPVAGIIQTGVGAVRPPRNSIFPAISLDFLPTEEQHRANNVPPYRRNSRQPPGTGSLQQMQQHRFRLIAAGVGRGNPVIIPRKQTFQKLVPKPPAAGFQPFPGTLRLFRNIDLQNPQFNPLFAAPVPDKRFIFVGLCPANPMIHMGTENSFPRKQGQQQMNHGHGICAAGKSCDHSPLPGNHPVLLHPSLHLLPCLTHAGTAPER